MSIPSLRALQAVFTEVGFHLPLPVVADIKEMAKIPDDMSLRLVSKSTRNAYDQDIGPERKKAIAEGALGLGTAAKGILEDAEKSNSYFYTFIRTLPEATNRSGPSTTYFLLFKKIRDEAKAISKRYSSFSIRSEENPATKNELKGQLRQFEIVSKKVNLQEGEKTKAGKKKKGRIVSREGVAKVSEFAEAWEQQFSDREFKKIADLQQQKGLYLNEEDDLFPTEIYMECDLRLHIKNSPFVESVFQLRIFPNVASTLGERISTITHLTLTKHAFYQVSPQIGQMVGLQQVDLSHNKIQSLPPEMKNLTKLTHLFLRKNLLSSFPPVIGELRSVGSLIVWDTRDNPMEVDEMEERVRSLLL